jgi:Ca-activated chloride channel family protein
VLTLFGYTLGGLAAPRLVALALVAVATLTALHLLREHRRRVQVPFALLWLEAAASQRPERLGHRLRRWLSWLLHLAVLGALLLALADPRPARAPAGGQSLLILIDQSASMAARAGERTRIDEARAEARRLVATLGDRDQALIAGFAASVQVEAGWSADGRGLGDAIERLAPRPERADLQSALAFATAALRERPRSRVIVIGDGAYDPVSAAALETRPVGTAVDNLAVAGLAAQHRPGDRGTVDAVVIVQSFAAARRRAIVELRGGAERNLLARAAVELAPGERSTRTLSWLAQGDDTLEATLLAPPGEAPDALALDDRAYAVIAQPPRRRILVVGAPNLYLDGALLSFGTELTVERAPSDRGQDLARYDAVIFDGVAPEPAPPGGKLLYLDPSGPGSPFPVRGLVRDPLATELERGHPLLAHLALADLNIREARRLQPAPDDHVVAAALGVPLVIARARPGLRVVALSFDPRRSDLPLRPTYPLLLANAFDWLAEKTAEGEAASERTGSVARVRVPGSATVATVVDPTGARTRRPVLAGWLELPLVRSGHHLVLPDDRTATPLAVAASFREPGESDTRTLRPAWFERLRPAGEDRRARGRLGGGSWAALAALALLLLEWWSYHRRWTV